MARKMTEETAADYLARTVDRDDEHPTSAADIEIGEDSAIVGFDIMPLRLRHYRTDSGETCHYLGPVEGWAGAHACGVFAIVQIPFTTAATGERVEVLSREEVATFSCDRMPAAEHLLAILCESHVDAGGSLDAMDDLDGIEMRKAAAVRNEPRDGWRKERVLQHQHGLCDYCGRPIFLDSSDQDSWATWDHIVPKTRGGGDSLGNLVLACHPCNIRKADMGAQAFRRLLAAEY